MQDQRLRLLCGAVLSVAAFVNVTGAIAVGVWWLLFTSRTSVLRNSRVIIATLGLFTAVAVITELSGGNGCSYLIRMTALLLVGAWLYAEYRPGDFLAVGTWLLGTRTGFEIGMIAEMALLMAEELLLDISRIRIAAQIKGQVWGIRCIIPTGRVIINDALQRADNIAIQLAVRGYRNGGTVCPVFMTTCRDLLGCGCAFLVLLIGAIPVSEFFILST
jgi:energy-coupling factor transport system permease protein